MLYFKNISEHFLIHLDIGTIFCFIQIYYFLFNYNIIIYSKKIDRKIGIPEIVWTDPYGWVWLDYNLLLIFYYAFE